LEEGKKDILDEMVIALENQYRSGSYEWILFCFSKNVGAVKFVRKPLDRKEAMIFSRIIKRKFTVENVLVVKFYLNAIRAMDLFAKIISKQMENTITKIILHVTAAKNLYRTVFFSQRTTIFTVKHALNSFLRDLNIAYDLLFTIV